MTGWQVYFAYGSNMLPARLLERTPSAQWLGVGQLPGYCLWFNHVSRKDRSAKCNIEPADPSQHGVWGVLYQVHEAERPVLDRAEDLGSGYHLDACRIRRGEDWLDAFCYIAVPGTLDDAARPFRWYRDIVLAGARLHDFPQPYVERIAHERVVDDPDHARAAHHQTLLT